MTVVGEGLKEKADIDSDWGWGAPDVGLRRFLGLTSGEGPGKLGADGSIFPQRTKNLIGKRNAHKR